MKHVFFLIFLGAVFSSNVYAQQVEYHYFDLRDGVRVDYRWTRSSLFDRGSDAVLYLQMTNENEFPVKIVFTVGFYRDEQLFVESAQNILCLAPGQRRRGSRSDMRYSADGINLAMTEEEWFSWDINDFDVEEASCE